MASRKRCFRSHEKHFATWERVSESGGGRYLHNPTNIFGTGRRAYPKKYMRMGYFVLLVGNIT